MRDYKKIKAWELAHELVLSVYRSTAHFPSSEQFGVTSQLRRAASSVPANIAEGSGRTTDKDFLRFLDIALGSLKETEYFLLLSKELNYLKKSGMGDASRTGNRGIKMFSWLYKSGSILMDLP